jgi:hypothetical protein
MLYFCNQNGIMTFCQSCLLVRFLVNTATLVWENCGFLSFSVIVTLVDSRDGLVEPLLWWFVIAPLLSFSLNFCKGTITVIVWKSEYRCNAVFAIWVTSVLIKKMSKIKLNLLFQILDFSKEWLLLLWKIVSEFVSFQSFLCFGVTK